MNGSPAAAEPGDFLGVMTTEYWSVSHRKDSALPGYLIVAARMPTNDLSRMPPAALAELGWLLARVQHALHAILQPEHLYIGRYGHTAGHSLHFHVIPVSAWVKRHFFADERYRVLQELSGRPSAAETDGAEMTLYIWREFCEKAGPLGIPGPGVSEIIERLRCLMNGTLHATDDPPWIRT